MCDAISYTQADANSGRNKKSVCVILQLILSEGLLTVCIYLMLFKVFWCFTNVLACFDSNPKGRMPWEEIQPHFIES